MRRVNADRQIRDFVAIVLHVIRPYFQMTRSPFKQCIEQNSRQYINLLYPDLMGFYTIRQCIYLENA